MKEYPNDIVSLTAEEAAANDSRFGLLSPKGEFFECCFMGHHNLAADLEDAGILKSKEYKSSYELVEDMGWVKFADRTFDKTPMEFTFAFQTTKKVSRPARPEEKSLMIMNGVRMVDDNIEIYHTVTKKQIDFIKALKKAQGEETVNFNWQQYTIPEFEKYVKEYNDYSKEQIKDAKVNVANSKRKKARV